GDRRPAAEAPGATGRPSGSAGAAAEQGQGARPPRGDRRPAAAAPGGRADPPAPPPSKVKVRDHREVTGGPRPRPRAAERIRRGPGRDHGRPSGTPACSSATETR